MRKNLKEARQRAGMTQKQVAEYLGVTIRTYQRMEEGTLLGNIQNWDALEDLFKVHQRVLRSEITRAELTAGKAGMKQKGGKQELMDKYRVRYWNEDGSESYMGFDTMEQAQGFYDSLDGKAEIQRYIEERHEYEVVVYPEFEF